MSIRFNFNHPVSELNWVLEKEDYIKITNERRKNSKVNYYYDYFNQHNFIIFGLFDDKENKFVKDVVYNYQLISLAKQEINEGVIRRYYHPRNIEKWIDETND
jgi:hypothetical protein